MNLVHDSLNETGFTFFFKREMDNAEMLKTKGALSIDLEGKVVLYEDKPEQDFERFNAFWCSFAFRRRAFDDCISFMEKSTLNQRVNIDEIKSTPIFQSKGIKVDDYTDLGTWEEIRRLLANHE